MSKGRISAIAILAVVILWASSTETARAQNGVIVDGQGVLKLRVFEDPGGRLMRERIAAARAALDQDVLRRSQKRMVSINRLEAALQDVLDNNRQPTDAMRYLAGLTRLEYVFYYPETRDIVVAGPAEGWVKDPSGRVVGMHSGQPTLELQDLIVALRTYAPEAAEDTIISVSIDPTQEGLQRMQQFLANLRGIRPADAAKIAAGLRTNLGLQNVAIRGVPSNTHFAQVLLEADYRMKLIGIGLEQPPVRMATYISKATPASVARNALKRWYFVPDYECVRVSDDELAMEMVGEGVKLLGEDQLVGADGRRSVAGVVDRASNLFTQSFTRMYPQMAAKSPIWAQMRNLIDMSVAAAFIREQGFHEQAQWNMNVFRDEGAYAVQTYNAPVKVETAVNIVWKGNTLMTPIGGGVNIQALKAIDSQVARIDQEGGVAEARDEIQLPADAARWWWD